MDFILKEANNLWRQMGYKAQAMKPESEHEKAMLAKIELRAETDPKLWSQVEGYVGEMLDLAAKTGNVKQTIEAMKTFWKEKQREFEEQEAQQKEREKNMIKDDLALSPAVQAIYQAQPAAE